jgi:hypothetical protein
MKKYPVYPEGKYFGIVYKVVPKWRVSRSGRRFCRYGVVVLLFKNLTNGHVFEKPVQFWFFPGPILKGGLGRGWNIDLNETALKLGVTPQSTDSKNILPISGIPVLIDITIIKVRLRNTASSRPRPGTGECPVAIIRRNKVESIQNANDHLTELPIPKDFDLDRYRDEHQ